MSDVFQTISPDQVPVVSAIPDGARVFIQQEGGPLQLIEHSSLLAKLIKTDLAKASSSILVADLAHGADSVALVFNDPDASKNGWWRKTGASGVGEWLQFETLSLTARQAAEEAAASAIAAANQAIAVLSSSSGGAVSTVMPTEDIAEGEFVHELEDNTCVLADATDPEKWATGFAPEAILAGHAGTVAGLGLNSAVTVSSFAAEVYLDPANPGGFTATIPTVEAGAAFIQPLGIAKPGVGIVFTPKTRTLL